MIGIIIVVKFLNFFHNQSGRDSYETSNQRLVLLTGFWLRSRESNDRRRWNFSHTWWNCLLPSLRPQSCVSLKTLHHRKTSIFLFGIDHWEMQNIKVRQNRITPFPLVIKRLCDDKTVKSSQPQQSILFQRQFHMYQPGRPPSGWPRV